MKKCSVCIELKSLDNFYTGLAQCKPCYRAKVRKYRQKNIDRIRAYDRARGCRQAPGYLRERRKRFPNQTKAQRKVAYEISKNNLIAEPCQECGSKKNLHAHHDDYAKPLNIRWLCAICHNQWHKVNGEGLNR